MPLCPASFAGVGLRVVVWKSLFSLGVYQDGLLLPREGALACVDVALGAAPVGDKERQGDERTPEGTFRITHRNPASAFHLSLGLSYPDKAHADAGLARGLIDAATHARVLAADKPGKMPLRSTRLGGDIYLHGGGAEPKDWTDGCVAMSDADIEWLYALAGPGTEVLILP